MNINADALAKLGQNALAFGRAYAALKEALVMQGVSEKEAREEARYAAALAAVFGDVRPGEECPLCNGSGKAP